jgi:hypothetical protein
MSETLKKIQGLMLSGSVRISAHGYDELADDGIIAQDAIAGLRTAIVVEDYPDYAKGPCVLVLEYETNGKPIHVLWGIAKGTNTPAVLITAYRPDPTRWDSDLLRRKS